MTGVAAVVVNNQNSDASLFCPIDDRVGEFVEWKGSACAFRRRTKVGQLFQQMRNAFKLIQEPARDTDTSLPLVEHRRLFQIVRSKAMD
jgi:hypothetical protein